MSLKKLAISGAFWVSIQLFGNQIISFGVSLILTRMLLPEEFGLVAMLGIFIGLANAFINSGLTQSLIRTEHLDDEDFSTVFYFNLIVSIVIYCISYFLAPLIAIFYNQIILTSIVRIYSLIFIINAFSTVQTTRLTKIMDFKTQTKVSMPSLIISSIIGVTLAFKGYGVWSLVLSSLSQALANTIQLWYWTNWKPIMVFNKVKFKKHFLYGVKLMFSGILDIVFTNVNTILIGKYFAPAQVGFYNQANTLQMIPVGNINTVINKVSFPLFSAIQDDDIRLKSIYSRIMQLVVFLVAPVLILIAVLGEPLFRFLFTEKWLPAVPYFKILCINGILYPLHTYNLQILKVKGRSDLFLKLEIFKKAIQLLVVILSFQFGIFGLLYGSVIFSGLAFFINTYYSGKYINYGALQQIRDLLPTILIATFVGSFIYLLNMYFINHISNDLNRISLYGFLGILSYLAISFLFKIKALVELKKIITFR